MLYNGSVTDWMYLTKNYSSRALQLYLSKKEHCYSVTQVLNSSSVESPAYPQASPPLGLCRCLTDNVTIVMNLVPLVDQLASQAKESERFCVHDERPLALGSPLNESRNRPNEGVAQDK